MQKFLITIVFLIFNLTFGQEEIDLTESLITEFKSEMKRENVSNFFIVKHTAYGGIRIIDLKASNNCNDNINHFLMYGFWKKGGSTWIKKYDNCGSFNSIKLTDSKIIEFYHKNIESLKKDEVKIYTVKPDSIANEKKNSYVSTCSHSPQRYFWFFKDSAEFKKNFDKYDLKTSKESLNLNYESNNGLSIVKLNLICEELIYQLEEKKMFNRLK